MKIRDYLYDHKFIILLYVLVIVFTGAVISMGESVTFNKSNGLYVMEVSLLAFFIYLTVDFLLTKQHHNRLNRLLKAEDIDWINALPAPTNSQQRLYHQLLERLYHQSNNKLDGYYANSMEYLEFITMWVHEIKTPISASKLIIENSIDNPTEQTLYSIEDEINRIEDFVQMTLFYSRAGDFAKDYVITGVSLDKIVSNCMKREYSSINNKQLVLQISDIKIEIDTDEKWLGFIIKQILDNAIVYSMPGNTIKIFTEQSTQETVLCIEDEGIGIKPEDIKRIFDKNFTGFNGRRLYTSTGLGLYLSQKLAKKLGHFITAESDFGSGTKIFVHFPMWNSYYEL